MAFSLHAATTRAAIRITEWIHSGNDGKFIESTNVGDTPFDMNGWSYNDSRIPGAFDLSGFGTVQPGKSVVFIEDPADVFHNTWFLGSEKKIIGDLGLPNGNGLHQSRGVSLMQRTQRMSARR